MATILSLCLISLHWTFNGYFRPWDEAAYLRFARAARDRRARDSANPDPKTSPSPERK